MDDVDDDDIKVVSEGKKAYEVDYKPLTHHQVKDLMVVDIEYISTIFGVEVCLMCVCIRQRSSYISYSTYPAERGSSAPSPSYGLE